MKEKLTLIYPRCEDKPKTVRLAEVLDDIMEDYDVKVIEFVKDFKPIHNEKVLFAICLGESGINLEYYRFLKILRTDFFYMCGCIGGVIVDGESELFTKSVAREITFAANQAGCYFPGRAMVEATGSMQNFMIQATNASTDVKSAYHAAASIMLKRVMAFAPNPKKKAKILVLHASNYETSNTFLMWNMVRKNLYDCEIEEISLRNGTVQDCSGCPYRMCMHFSKKASCYYGGVISERVYPAIIECDALMLLCPNYNDALSANMTAFINRLTALFRHMQFYDKNLFSIIISGYSGGNILAEQIISSLNMNKTFRLPPRFAFIETANTPASILEVNRIEECAAAYARRMMEVLIREP